MGIEQQSITIDHETEHAMTPLGESATGTIEPSLDEIELQLLKERLDAAYAATDITVVCKCIDGRDCLGGLLAPNSAGGTLGLAVVRDVVRSRGDMPEGFDGMFQDTIGILAAKRAPIGGHGAVGGSGDHTGCGASDKLADIYTKWRDEAELIQVLAKSLDVATVAHAQIAESVENRVVFSEYGASGLRKVSLHESGGVIEELEGSHAEQLIVINTQPGTTLDRKLLEEQVFNVDVWAFEASVRAVLGKDATSEEIEAGVLALVEFNIAAALVLCGPSMRIVVR
jgi:hypothetical protein